MLHLNRARYPCIPVPSKPGKDCAGKRKEEGWKVWSKTARISGLDSLKESRGNYERAICGFDMIDLTQFPCWLVRMKDDESKLMGDPSSFVDSWGQQAGKHEV